MKIAGIQTVIGEGSKTNIMSNFFLNKNNDLNIPPIMNEK